MPRRLIAFLSANWTYLLFVLGAAYLAYSAGQSALRNYQNQQQIQNLRQELADANIERQRLEALVVYYKTDTFKEEELRRTFLLVRPGEQVYALPESSHVRSLDNDTGQTEGRLVTAAVATTEPKADSIWKRWLRYIF